MHVLTRVKLILPCSGRTKSVAEIEVYLDGQVQVHASFMMQTNVGRAPLLSTIV